MIKGRFWLAWWKGLRVCFVCKTVGYAGVQWILAGLFKKMTLKKKGRFSNRLFYEKNTLEKRGEYKTAFFKHDWELWTLLRTLRT